MEGIWAVLRERLDYASFVPRLVPDIERAELRRRDGSTYYVLKNPRGERGAGLYVRLEPEDLRLVDLMDGVRTVQDILVAHLERQGTFALDRLARVTAVLGANGFFGEERAPVYFRRDGDVSATLRQLRAGGTRIGVFTDAPVELARVALSHLGAERHVEVLETGAGAQERVSEALGEHARIVNTRAELLAVT